MGTSPERPSERHPVTADTAGGWVRRRLATGLNDPAEVVAEVVGGTGPPTLPRDLADVERLVDEVAAEHRAHQPQPSADARALVTAASTLVRAGVLVRLGDVEARDEARDDALRRATEARRGGAMVAGAAYASRAALETMLLTRRLELGVVPLGTDDHSAVGEQITAALGLRRASATTVGEHVVAALVAAGLPATWDGADSSPVVVEPVDFAAPLTG